MPPRNGEGIIYKNVKDENMLVSLRNDLENALTPFVSFSKPLKKKLLATIYEGKSRNINSVYKQLSNIPERIDQVLLRLTVFYGDKILSEYDFATRRILT